LAVIFFVAAAAAMANTVGLEAFSGVVAGTNTCLTGGQPAAWAFFGTNLGFDIGGTGNGISDCGLSGGIDDVVTGGATPAMSSQSLSNATYTGYTGTLYSGSAVATANFGNITLGADGSLNGPYGGSGAPADAGAFGLTTDQIVTNASYLSFTFMINASISGTNVASGNIGVEMDMPLVNGGNPFYVFHGTTAGVNVPGTISNCTQQTVGFDCADAIFSTAFLPVTPNTLFALQIGMEAVADLSNGPGNVDASFDPGSLELIGISAENASQQAITNFMIQSASGAVYGADGVESEPSSDVPEPATALEGVMALIAFGVWRALECNLKSRRKRVTIPF
jgi:hypothetical protein